MNTFFNKNIRYLRKQNQMSQAKLAKIVNKERSLIGHWENGSREATLEDIVKLSDFFHISIDKMVGIDLSNTENVIENDNEKNLKAFALNYGAKLLIDKTTPLSAESALIIQNEIQQILLKEINLSKMAR